MGTQVCLFPRHMVRRRLRVMAVYLDIRAEHLDPPFLVKVGPPANLVFHVQQEHQLHVVLLFLVLVLREALHLPVGLPVLRHLRADLRKDTRPLRLPHATDLRRLRLAPPLLLQALVPYPWIPLSYPEHLRWSKSRCSAK